MAKCVMKIKSDNLQLHLSTGCLRADIVKLTSAAQLTCLSRKLTLRELCEPNP